MFLVYGLIALFGMEWAYRKLRGRHWLLRGAVYMTVVLVMECASGWVLRAATGYDIWYYSDPYAILRYTSLAIGPMWFVLGLTSENFIHIIDKLTRVKLEQGAREEGREP